MTPDEEAALERQIAADIDKAALAAYESIVNDIRAGMAPRDAVQKAIDTFNGEYATLFAAALSKVLAESIGSPMDIQVGTIKLSSRLYANSLTTSAIVEGVVRNHTRGFQDARQLALLLYEGYDFRPEEPLVIKRTNSALPRYLKEALLPDPGIERELAKAFAKSQADALRTNALRAAYRELLAAIEKVEAGAGDEYLAKKLQTAVHEKLRYFATRIARTELHRAFAESQARELMQDDDVVYVQWRLNPAHPIEDICDYFAGVDMWGLGPGVYPKAKAPVAPAHPHCMCVLSPRLDLNDKKVRPTKEADQKYFRKLRPDLRRRIAGSTKKLERIQQGESALSVHNANIDPIYKVKLAGDL